MGGFLMPILDQNIQYGNINLSYKSECYGPMIRVLYWLRNAAVDDNYVIRHEWPANDVIKWTALSNVSRQCCKQDTHHSINGRNPFSPRK